MTKKASNYLTSTIPPKPVLDLIGERGSGFLFPGSSAFAEDDEYYAKFTG